MPVDQAREILANPAIILFGSSHLGFADLELDNYVTFVVPSAIREVTNAV